MVSPFDSTLAVGQGYFEGSTTGFVVVVLVVVDHRVLPVGAFPSVGGRLRRITTTTMITTTIHQSAWWHPMVFGIWFASTSNMLRAELAAVF